MAVGLLEQAEKETQLSNKDNARLSYGEACVLDAQNIDANVQSAVYEYTVDSNSFNSYERTRFHLSSGNGSDENIYENSAPTLEGYEALVEYLNSGELLFDVYLHRGTSLGNLCGAITLENIDAANFSKDIQNMDDIELSEKYRDQIFTYRQFVSTSISPHVARDFLAYPAPCLLEIEAPKGTPGRCVQELSGNPDEKEVLLNSCTQFRIVKIRTQPDGMKCIWARVVVDEAEKNDDNADGNL